MWPVPCHPLPSIIKHIQLEVSLHSSTTRISISKALGIWWANVDQVLAGCQRGQKGQLLLFMSHDATGQVRWWQSSLPYYTFLCPSPSVVAPRGLHQIISLWLNSHLFWTASKVPLASPATDMPMVPKPQFPQEFNLLSAQVLSICKLLLGEPRAWEGPVVTYKALFGAAKPWLL